MGKQKVLLMLSWLLCLAPAEKKGSAKPRTAALDFTRALNHALGAVDLPLWRFKMGPWRELPLLVLCMDEGSSAYAAVWYLLHVNRLRCLPCTCRHGLMSSLLRRCCTLWLLCL